LILLGSLLSICEGVRDLEGSQVSTSPSYDTLAVDKKINLWAFRYDVNKDLMTRVAICESGLNPLAVGDNGTSLGLFQYKQRTFDWFSDMSGIRGDIWDEDTQIELTAWAFSQGLQHHWSCYKNHYAGRTNLKES